VRFAKTISRYPRTCRKRNNRNTKRDMNKKTNKLFGSRKRIRYYFIVSVVPICYVESRYVPITYRISFAEIHNSRNSNCYSYVH